MRRREFITLLGGAAVAWPVVARAQQSERVRRIGVLAGVGASDLDAQARLAAFLQALQQLGWTNGRNVRLDVRWAAGNADDARKYAAELVALGPDVILAHGGSVVGPLLQATRTVPVVFTVVADPVAAGFVDSLAHPGGNATGFSQFELSLILILRTVRYLRPMMAASAEMSHVRFTLNSGHVQCNSACPLSAKSRLQYDAGDSEAAQRCGARSDAGQQLRIGHAFWLLAAVHRSDCGAGSDRAARWQVRS